ncbi:hypothetical protein IscW_ISCW000587 [Ixodes scapularis]|uniref:Uncharacterized protein n=1 Tax=Ixodes scapularis TaxID=6945 RepID=B7P381_IXOSC|nr:hypothetical protein IscW_ISCW000587 [Ixodes scapularis]|eukprot:XP_002403657.1 hypothetical protein IscW_ISCW000587 [Ixodes scapularis]
MAASLLSRLPSTLKQTPGDRVFDHDEVNEVDIGVEKRLEEETVDNDRAFSRRLDGAHKKRFAEKQNAKSSYQETAPGPGETRTLRRLKTKKRTVQGKTVITKFTTRKEEEQSTMSPTGEKDCRRNVDEAGTTDENIETHEEELVETYGDD